MKKIMILASLLAMTTALLAQTFVSTKHENRKVLIEEFTGVGCQYCPLGHKATDQTLEAYPGKAFAINIHQGMFATQYTTQWGNALASMANVTGYPSATMNRHAFSGISVQMNPGQALPFAQKILEMPTPVNVAATVDLDPITRLMVVKVEVYYSGNAPGDFNLLNVALVQNNVLAMQAGASSYYPENMVGGQYRHKHILRHLLTGQWGDTIRNNRAGATFTKEYAYVVPQRIGDLDVPNVDDLSVLVFVCQNHTEVLNVCEAIRIADKAYMAYGEAGGNECSLEFNPNVTVVNPTSSPISGLRFQVDGQTLVCNKTIAPYCSDTVQLKEYIVNTMPTDHQDFAQTLQVQFTGYTKNGSSVTVSGEPLTIEYGNADIYTVEGPLTLSIKYDGYPEETSFTLSGMADCQYYYNIAGTAADGGRTVSYTLSPATAGLYRLKVYDIGGDGLSGTVSVTDANGNTLFSRSGKDLLRWDNYYFNITNDGTDGPTGAVLGIDRPAAAHTGWALWPNPASTQLHVECAAALRQVQVLDLSGRVLSTTSDHEVDVQALPAGLYLLRIVTADGVSVKKFIKQ
jgi:hypothetical protein